MLNERLKDLVVGRLLPCVEKPSQYLGGELNMIRKDHRTVRGRLCLAFPDTYTIGMSHHGLQVLYSLMNARGDWACERAFCPWDDMETQLRKHGVPLYSLETFTPLSEFDVVGFSLQYEICFTNLLTMLDLAGIPLHAADRTAEHPLIIAGGPCAQNPEPIAPFVDLFVTGDGEPSLPVICDEWLQRIESRGLRRRSGNIAASVRRAGDGSPPLTSRCANGFDSDGNANGNGIKQAGPLFETEAQWGADAPRSPVDVESIAGRKDRESILAELAARIPFAYVPRFYEPEYFADGRLAALTRTRTDVPESIEPAVITDLEAIPLPTAPVVPYVECVHDRIAIEIMRGCPWQCRFCQSTVIKRPMRMRSVETIVQAALESYRNTGFNEISILSLSTSDYPQFMELMHRLKEVLGPLGVNISIPSLRVNEILKSVASLIGSERQSSLTLAPEVARDDMREQIRKKISNQDLFDGCREAFRNGFRQVKLYFLCGLPGERPVDLDGIVDMAETISRIGREELGFLAKVTASVSNFVPKSHTPYQWNGMQTREYFHWAHRYMWKRKQLKSVNIKCHPVETSLLEGVLSRGDRRLAPAIELAWRRGARLDSWMERIKPDIWWQALADSVVNIEQIVHQPVPLDGKLPWDHLNVKKGRAYLEKEQQRSVVQLAEMAEAK